MYSTEGGETSGTTFVCIIAPVVSGCIITIFTFWLNNRNK
ncbi:type I toxin-antitoxin system Fst family toxin [Staphylococcus gallinarum]